MKPRLFLLAELLTAATLTTSGAQLTKDGGDKPATPPPPDGPQILRPSKPSKPAARALAWSLMPDPLDQAPGNAAQTWIRAGLAARNARFKWTDKEDAWLGPGEGGTPLDKLPLKDVKE